MMNQEQALVALETENEDFTDALAWLVRHAAAASVEALVNTYQTLQARKGQDRGHYARIRNLELALLATKREEAVRAVVQPQIERDYPHARLEGLLLRGLPEAFFWRENSWQIRANEGMQAISRLWAPLAELAPDFAHRLHTHTLALVLFTPEASEECFLGYVHLVPWSRYDLEKAGITRKQPISIEMDRLTDWLDLGLVGLCVGYPPRDPAQEQVEQLPLFRLPLALRELYAIHAGLQSAIACGIFAPHELAPLLDDEWAKAEEYVQRFHEANQGCSPDQFVEFCWDGNGNAQVFDLDCLDERQDPLVAFWDHETWEVGAREPFWPWFAAYSPHYIL